MRASISTLQGQSWSEFKTVGKEGISKAMLQCSERGYVNVFGVKESVETFTDNLSSKYPLPFTVEESTDKTGRPFFKISFNDDSCGY